MRTLLFLFVFFALIGSPTSVFADPLDITPPDTPIGEICPNNDACPDQGNVPYEACSHEGTANCNCVPEQICDASDRYTTAVLQAYWNQQSQSSGGSQGIGQTTIGGQGGQGGQSQGGGGGGAQSGTIASTEGDQDNDAAQRGGLINPLKADSVEELFVIVLQAAKTILGMILVLALLWCGWLFIEAQGNEDKLKKARTAFMWTVVGGIVVLGITGIFEVIQGTLSELTTD